jgi:hypothetical protein
MSVTKKTLVCALISSSPQPSSASGGDRGTSRGPGPPNIQKFCLYPLVSLLKVPINVAFYYFVPPQQLARVEIFSLAPLV